jgi:hypothetical protein
MSKEGKKIKNYQKILAIFLVIIIAGSILWIIISKPTFPPADSQKEKLALDIVDAHLLQLHAIDGFKDCKIAEVHPIYDYMLKTTKAYDIKLVSEEGKDNGYIIAGVEKNDYPILEFSDSGPSLWEQMQNKLDTDGFGLIWLTSTYSIAVDAYGKVLDTIGSYMEDSQGLATLENKEGSDYYTSLHKLISEKRADYLAKYSVEISNQWDEIFEVIKYVEHTGSSTQRPPVSNSIMPILTTPIDAQEELPEDKIWTQKFVYDYTTKIDVNEIPPNEGYNYEDRWTGCAATAWTNLMVYHDLTFTPDLLIGSQKSTGWSDWGGQKKGFTYLDRVNIEISEKLGTYQFFSDIGLVWDWNMKKGYDYIEEMGFEITGKHFEERTKPEFWDPTEPEFYNPLFALVNDADEELAQMWTLEHVEEKPVLIKIPGHFCTAVGKVYKNTTTGDLEDSRWVIIHYGRTDHTMKKYIPKCDIEQFWYLDSIYPSEDAKYRLTKYNFRTSFTPEVVAAPDNSLWIFWREDNGKISYMFGDPNKFPDPATKQTIDVFSKYSPSLLISECDDGWRFFLCFVDSNDEIKLFSRKFESENVRSYNFESVGSFNQLYLKTNIRPEIAGDFGNFLTVTFHTPRDWNLPYDGLQLISSSTDFFDGDYTQQEFDTLVWYGIMEQHPEFWNWMNSDPESITNTPYWPEIMGQRIGRINLDEQTIDVLGYWKQIREDETSLSQVVELDLIRAKIKPNLEPITTYDGEPRNPRDYNVLSYRLGGRVSSWKERSNVVIRINYASEEPDYNDIWGIKEPSFFSLENEEIAKLSDDIFYNLYVKREKFNEYTYTLEGNLPSGVFMHSPTNDDSGAIFLVGQYLEKNMDCHHDDYLGIYQFTFQRPTAFGSLTMPNNYTQAAYNKIAGMQVTNDHYNGGKTYETSNPGLTCWMRSNGLNPTLVMAWSDVETKEITIRTLSIDPSGNLINYAKFP